jgi:hypothetical protein
MLLNYVNTQQSIKSKILHLNCDCVKKQHGELKEIEITIESSNHWSDF